MKRLARRPWTLRESALLVLMLLVGIWTLRQPLLDIIAIGMRDEEQSHIFLAPFVAAWLLWLRRSRLRNIGFTPSLIGPGVVLMGWTLSWIGFERGIQLFWHGGAVLALLGIVLSMTGLGVVRQFLPAVAVLAFVLPVPGRIRQAIAIPLQEQATVVTENMLQVMGVPVFRDGIVLIINDEAVAVGEACNGMRMVFALTLVVYAFAFGTPLRPGTRVLLLLISPVLALLSNVIRLVPTSLFYGYSTVERAHAFHDLAGWVMLPILLMILLGMLRMFRWLEFPVTSYRLSSSH